MAVVLLTVGLVAVAGLLRSVALQVGQARADGEMALVAQAILEQALVAPKGAPHADTLWFGSRAYAVSTRIEHVASDLQRIRLVATPVGPLGFGSAPSRREFFTYRTTVAPRPLPP